MVTGAAFKALAVRALASNGNIALSEDVPLAALGPAQTKTLLRAGSATSVGAFQSLDAGREYAPARRPLELLDLVRLGTTDEAAVPYMRQTTYTPRSGGGRRGHVDHDRHEARGDAAVRGGVVPGRVDRVVGARHPPRARRR